MFRKFAFVLSVIGLFAADAGAVVRPGWDRPVLRADMEVTDALYGFSKVSDVSLVMTRRDGQTDVTGLTLRFDTGIERLPQTAEGDHRSVKLLVQHVSTDGCGSKQYVANLLPAPGRRPMDAMHRFTVVLTDHTTRVCEDYRPHLWEASVSEGYGFCGTMDDRMTLVGNPEPVYTIQ